MIMAFIFSPRTSSLNSSLRLIRICSLARSADSRALRVRNDAEGAPPPSEILGHISSGVELPQDRCVTIGWDVFF